MGWMLQAMGGPGLENRLPWTVPSLYSRLLKTDWLSLEENWNHHHNLLVELLPHKQVNLSYNFSLKILEKKRSLQFGVNLQASQLLL